MSGRRASRTNPGGAARWRLRITVLLALALACAACGGAADSTTTTAGPAVGGINVTEYEVEWDEDAAVLDDVDGVAAARVSADHIAGRFVFDATYDGVDQLEVGRPALLAGLGVYRITGRQETAAGVEITVEPGLLTDVIENGRITFNSNVMADPEAWVTVAADGGSQTVMNGAGGGPLLVSAVMPVQTAKLSYSGNIEGFATTFELSDRA